MDFIHCKKKGHIYIVYIIYILYIYVIYIWQIIAWHCTYYQLDTIVLFQVDLFTFYSLHIYTG